MKLTRIYSCSRRKSDDVKYSKKKCIRNLKTIRKIIGPVKAQWATLLRGACICQYV